MRYVSKQELQAFEKKKTSMISKHWGKKSIEITDAVTRVAKERWLIKDPIGHYLCKSELLQGELAAMIIPIDCYLVRSAVRVYRINDGYYNPGNETPATDEVVAEVGSMGFSSILDMREYRIVHEISAKHIKDPYDVFKGEFKNICRAAESRSYDWTESIGSIFTIRSSSKNNERTSLMVEKFFSGSSFGAQNLYELTPKGTVLKTRKHDLDR